MEPFSSPSCSISQPLHETPQKILEVFPTSLEALPKINASKCFSLTTPSVPITPSSQPLPLLNYFSSDDEVMKIHSHFQRVGMHIRKSYIKEKIAQYVERSAIKASNSEQIYNFIYDNFISSDLVTSGEGSLPGSIHTIGKGVLSGTHFLQLLGYANIGEPSKNRVSLNGNRRYLKLHFTDGKEDIYCFEYRYMKKIKKENLKKFTKILLCESPEIRKGLVLVQESNIKIIWVGSEEIYQNNRQSDNHINENKNSGVINNGENINSTDAGNYSNINNSYGNNRAQNNNSYNNADDDCSPLIPLRTVLVEKDTCKNSSKSETQRSINYVNNQNSKEAEEKYKHDIFKDDSTSTNNNSYRLKKRSSNSITPRRNSRNISNQYKDCNNVYQRRWMPKELDDEIIDISGICTPPSKVNSEYEITSSPRDIASSPRRVFLDISYGNKSCDRSDPCMINNRKPGNNNHMNVSMDTNIDNNCNVDDNHDVSNPSKHLYDSHASEICPSNLEIIDIDSPELSSPKTVNDVKYNDQIDEWDNHNTSTVDDADNHDYDISALIRNIDTKFDGFVKNFEKQDDSKCFDKRTMAVAIDVCDAHESSSNNNAHFLNSSSNNDKARSIAIEDARPKSKCYISNDIQISIQDDRNLINVNMCNGKKTIMCNETCDNREIEHIGRDEDRESFYNEVDVSRERETVSPKKMKLLIQNSFSSESENYSSDRDAEEKETAEILARASALTTP